MVGLLSLKRTKMRKREVIEKDGTKLEVLQLEVLLDLRELLTKPETKKRGRPAKSKIGGV